MGSSAYYYSTRTIPQRSIHIAGSIIPSRVPKPPSQLLPNGPCGGDSGGGPGGSPGGGGFNDALNDFDKLNPRNVKDITSGKKGKVGDLPGGRKVNE